MSSAYLKRTTIGAILYSVTVGSSAFAATVSTYTDEATFLADLASSTTLSFDDPPFDSLDDGFLVGFPFETLDQQFAGLDFDNAVVFPGCCGGTSNSAPNVVLNADVFGGSPIVINFLTPVDGVGLYNTSLVDAERFTVYGAGNVLLGQIDLASGVVNYGGFISDMPIVRAEIVGIAPTNGSIFIDDLSYGNTSSSSVPTPEPASLALLGLGLAGLGLYRRRRAH